MIAAEKAKQLLREFSITTTPALSINRIFEHYKIIYDEMEYSDSNYMGSLVRAEGKTIILINTDIKNVGRINFTKAHELGHFSLGHKGQEFECSQSDMFGFTRNMLEIEANQFAREFLLPIQMVKPIVVSAPFDFTTINAIKDRFLVSKLTTVFRILDFHNSSYAFIYSQCGKIKHVGMSTFLKGKINFRKPGAVIDDRSFAYVCLNSNSRMNGYTAVDPSVWITKNHTKSKIVLKEYSKENMTAGTVMTLLKVDFL